MAGRRPARLFGLLDPIHEAVAQGPSKAVASARSEGGGKVFWCKPGGRFGWVGSKEWICKLTQIDLENLRNKSNTEKARVIQRFDLARRQKATFKKLLANMTAGGNLHSEMTRINGIPRRNAPKAAQAVDAVAEANAAKAKAGKDVNVAVFRMCTASEVQEVLNAKGKLEPLYPEDNQWVAYRSW